MLVDYEPSLGICNSFYVDKVLWLSAETVKRYTEYNNNKQNNKTCETSP